MKTKTWIAAVLLCLVLALLAVAVVCFLGSARVTSGTAPAGTAPAGAPTVAAAITFEGPYRFACRRGPMIDTMWVFVGKIQQADVYAFTRSLGIPLTERDRPTALDNQMTSWGLNRTDFGLNGAGPWYSAMGSVKGGLYAWVYYAKDTHYVFIRFQPQ